MGKFGLSIEGSSMFFIINITSYFVTLHYMNQITNKIGLKMTIVCGLFLLFFGALFLAPISILPQSMLTVIIGLVILGIPEALINVNSICDLNEYFKNSKLKIDEASANDLSSSIYNLGLNFGEAVGPIFGGYITEKYDFETSCVYTSLINLFYCGVFFLFNYKIILNHFNGLITLGDPGLDEGVGLGTGSPYKFLLDNETEVQIIKSKENSICKYKPLSYSSRGSKISFRVYHE